MDNTNENMTEDKDINKNNNGNSDDYEKICFVCRRPESRAGKMIVMPNNIYICQDCMQRTFDSINSSGINYEDMMKMSNMPGTVSYTHLYNTVPYSGCRTDSFEIRF